MPTISIKATDTLFFRDGAPFSMGDDSFAQGIFPPPPSVIYGALRSAYIANGLESSFQIDDLIKDSNALRFNHLALISDSSQYFPLPQDLIVPKQDGIKKLKTLGLKLENKPAISSTQIPLILKSNDDGKSEDEPFLLQLLALEEYFEGKLEDLPVKRRSDFICLEPKIGIGRSRDTNTTDEGKLFRIQANRLSKTDSNGNIKNLQFTIGFDGIALPGNGWLTLGAERRVAFFHIAEPIVVTCPDLVNTRFKIYLSTPALFEDGWKPTSLLKKYGLTLLAAAIGRPLPIGGWDLEKKRPKPMLQAVPAGSVYYVEAPSAEAAKAAAKAIHGNAISDNLNNTNYQAQGFGIAYIGKIL